jgi:hypothetical protein
MTKTPRRSINKTCTLKTRPLQATLNSAPASLARPLRIGPNVTERLPNMAYMDDLKTLLDLDRQFHRVLAVLLRQQDLLDTGTQSSDQLLFDTTDGHDLAAQ